ncbi:Uncharacterised protein [Shigella sonnei]|nr:Uncharacterised protein [Shigella sonnei]CSG21902.1 Uncharacterised protein [Shigella sonnei]CSN51170.1 Uncharacterised protein [Shigella sonnei]
MLPEGPALSGAFQSEGVSVPATSDVIGMMPVTPELVISALGLPDTGITHNGSFVLKRITQSAKVIPPLLPEGRKGLSINATVPPATLTENSPGMAESIFHLESDIVFSACF